MKVRVYTANNESENHVLKSFYEGCPVEDKKILDLDFYEPSDVAVVFGTYKKQVPISYRRGNVVHQQKTASQKTVILETGYLNRGSKSYDYYAAGLDGLNGRATFHNENSPADRAYIFRESVKPWREDGKHILLCGQVPWDASVDHIDFLDWTRKTSDSLYRATPRHIVYRSHPLVKTPAPDGTTRSTKMHLQDDLEDCWVVVTFNSNSAVEAALAGIPVIAVDEGSMALPIANSIGEINNPRTPDRTQWLNNLCYAQWTPKEMSGGMAWNQLFR
jgi:hypothetical protein